MNGTARSGFTPDLKNLTATSATLLVAAFSLLINTIVLIDYQQSPFGNFLLWDAARYWQWALDIVHGGWWGTTVFHQAPLYPYLLGVFISLFGEHLFPIYLFQCLTGAATSALICSVSIKTVNDPRAGLITGLLYALYGMQVFYTTKILSECIAALLLILVVRSLYLKKGTSAALAAGGTMGLLLLAKPHFLPAVPLCAGFFFLRPDYSRIKQALRKACLFLATLLIIVGIVTLRNYRIAGEFVLVSSNGGENFYIGNHEKANGTYLPVEGISSDIAYQQYDVMATAREAAGRELTRAEASRYWFSRGLGFVWNNPRAWLRLELTKLLNIFSNADLSNMYTMRFEQQNLTPSFAIPFVGWYLLLPLFFVGVVATRTVWRTHFPVLVFLTVNMLNIMLFFYDTRFMVVMMPVFVVIGGTGVWHLLRWLRTATSLKQATLHPATIVLLCGISLTLLVGIRDRSFPSQDWRMWMSLGDINFGLDRIDESLDYYIKASELNKRNCMPAFGVCKSLFKRGNRKEAAGLYQSTFATTGPDDRTTILRDPDFDGLRAFIGQTASVQASRPVSPPR